MQEVINGLIDPTISDPWKLIKVGQYDPGGHQGSFSTQAAAQNRFMAIPFNVSRDRSYDFVGISISSAVANYTTGTCTFTQSSTAVTGSGTTFASTHVGARIKSNADGVWYVIASVTDATNLVLATTYAESGGSGHAYTINHRARLGIYNDGGAALPTTLIEDWGEIGLESTNLVTIDITDRSLTKGLYWLIVHAQAAATFNAWALGAWTPMGLRNTGSGALKETEGAYYTDGRTYQALPSNAPSFATLGATKAPTMSLRVKSND